MAADPRIVLGPSGAARSRLNTSNAESAWRWVAWLSLVLTLAGVGDWVLAWVPLRLGNPEWEFGTIVASFSGLPLVAIGFAGLLGSAWARGIHWQVRTVGWVVLVWAVMIAGALVVFFLDVPLALAAAQGPIRLGIVKATVKTVALGVLFSVAFVVIGVAALRRPRSVQ